MAALSAALFLVRWRGALHAISYDEISYKNPSSYLPTLSEICCKILVADSSFTKRILKFLPRQLYSLLMKASVAAGNDRTIEVLMPLWPARVLRLQELWPHMYDTLDVIYDNNLHTARIRQGIIITSNLINAFFGLIKSRQNIPYLKILDITEFPTVDQTVSHLAQGIMMMHENESEDSFENSADGSCESHRYDIYIDCIVRDEDTFRELCNAINLCETKKTTIRLHISKIDASCLGCSQICTLLDTLNANELTGLCIQYNSLSNSGLLHLIPHLQHLKFLTALDVSCNNINLFQAPETCEKLAGVLESLVLLQRLDISNNRLTNCVHLLFGRLKNTKLEYLKLSACVLSDNDLRFLTRLVGSWNLKEVDLSENVALSQHIDLAMLTAFIIPLSTSLLILELEDCKFNNIQVAILVQSLLIMNHLRYLNVARHAFASNILCDEFPRLGSLPNLECIRLSYTEDCYVQVDSSLHIQHKANLKEQMEKGTLKYRLILSPPKPNLIFIWVELFSFL